MTQQHLFLLTQESSVVDTSTMAPSSVLQRTGWIITWSLMAFFVLLVAATELNDDVSSSLVARLEKRELVEGSHFWPEPSKRRKRDTSATTSEEIAICKKQGETFLTDLKNGQGIDKEVIIILCGDRNRLEFVYLKGLSIFVFIMSKFKYNISPRFVCFLWVVAKQNCLCTNWHFFFIKGSSLRSILISYDF